MTTYLVVTGENPNYVTRVDAESLCDAIEELGLENGESAVVYRVPMLEPVSVGFPGAGCGKACGVDT